MPTKVGKLRLAYDLWKQYGTRNFGYRLYHHAVRRAGLLKHRFPTVSWGDRPLAFWCRDDVPTDPETYRAFRQRGERRFFFPPGQLPQVPREWTVEAIRKADDVLVGRLQFFSALSHDLGFPFDWFFNPMTGGRVDAARHWCDRNEFEADQGDIKFIWEPSRFGWVFWLVRAYAATGDERYPAGYWQLLESWAAANPPNMGPNWQCGQECAIRAIAITFGLYGFWRSRETTAERVARLSALLAVHAQRIQDNIRFAQVQMGNHALSEAVALYMIGLLFPEFHKAESWRRHGHAIIDFEARNHSYSDGAYIQHSFNYHRLMLHDFLFALRLAELNGDRFDPWTSEMVDRHGQFLYYMQNPENGYVPNYGQNDGALLLPLNDCPYLDYRPVTEAVHYQVHRRRLYEPGPWDEDLYWLYGAEAATAPREKHERQSRRFDVGGYYTLRGRETWAMIRCHTIIHHPHQADMLHLDLWWRGMNVLRDSGSFSYNAPEPWRHYFVSTAAHNAVEIGGESQMIRPQRFSWTYLTRSRLHHYRPGIAANVDFLQGEHYGYQRLASRAVHRRAVLRLEERFWVIVDDIFGSGTEQVRLFWQLLDVPYQVEGRRVTLDTKQGAITLDVIACPAAEIEVARGRETPSAMGWRSIHYGERLPAPTLCLSMEEQLPQRMITVLALGGTGPIAYDAVERRLSWSAPDGTNMYKVTLAALAPGSAPAVTGFQAADSAAELAGTSAALGSTQGTPAG